VRHCSSFKTDNCLDQMVMCHKIRNEHTGVADPDPYSFELLDPDPGVKIALDTGKSP
jgi:hypothetical protein